VFLINTEMCMSWLILILIVSMHGSTMKFNIGIVESVSEIV